MNILAKHPVNATVTIVTHAEPVMPYWGISI